MRIRLLALVLLAATPLALPLAAQSTPPTPSDIAGFGPLDPSQPTGITIPDIIKRMGEREAEFEHARDQYTFRQTVKMDTISDDTGKPDGEFADVEDITFDAAGHRVERVVFAPGNTLERVIMTENDVNDIKERLPFILTTAQLPEYNLTYLGQAESRRARHLRLRRRPQGDSSKAIATSRARSGSTSRTSRSCSSTA